MPNRNSHRNHKKPLNYGVLKCIPKEYLMAIDENHVEVLVVDGEETKYRLAINVRSEDESEVLYYVGKDFNSDDITKLPKLDFGFTNIRNNNPDIALDYIRGNLLIPSNMVPLPNREVGPDNDLYEKITYYIQKAIDEDGILYVYGDRWGPEHNKKDKYFGFLPGNGVHNIHMNQGNIGKHAKDNGVWHDGGVLIHFEQENKWVAIFLAFQSQSWCTGDKGHPIEPVEVCNHSTVGNLQ